MFGVGAPELMLLIVVAIVMFGPERLPELIRKARGIIQYVRTMAGEAQSQLGKELGPGFEDIDLRDLNPKAFIQKHLLDDVDTIVADVKSEFTLDGTSSSTSSDDPSSDDPAPELVAAATARTPTPFDSDAT